MKNHTFLRDLIQKSRLYWSLIKIQRSGKHKPIIASLFVTGKCNAKCTYCYVEIDKTPEREFSANEWKALIDNLYNRGTRMFSLVGGEPFLYPHIDDLVDHIVSKNVFLNLTTNGFLIDKHLDAAKKAAEVSISLDGDKASHNNNRGRSNFEKTVKGIDLAVANGIKVRLCTVVTRNNFDQIAFLIDFAEKRNLFISFTPLIDAPDIRKEDANDLRLSNEKILEFFSLLKETKKKSSRIINSFESLNYLCNYPVKYGDIIWKNSPYSNYYNLPCPYGRFQYLFTNVGEVYPCQIMWNNNSYYSPKNIFDVGLNEALAHASKALPCQCCSFANAVDWNSITSMPWLWYGLKMTLKQAFTKYL